MGADRGIPVSPATIVARLKRQYGDRITFCGGIDSQFVSARPGATPDDVRAEVRAHRRDGRWGRLYQRPRASSVPYAPELLHAMTDEIAGYGRSYYRPPA